MSYTEIFGGESINPTQLSYIAYESAANLTLVWPFEAPPSANVAADKIDVTMTVASRSVTMPPANQISVGQDVLIRNTGVFTFTVLDNDGFEIGSVASGEAWYFVVIENDTEAGNWYAIEFGAGTSSATAASLAGAGLRANVNKLDQNLLTTSISGSRTIVAADRATVLQNTGGVANWTFLSASSLTNGFFVYIINAGTGDLTLTPAGGETIDGVANKMLMPDESLIAFSDGSNIHTLGYGRALVSTVTAASINVAGTGTSTLNAVQTAAQIQDFNGTLTGNRIIEYGGDVGYWFVLNNTSGAFDLTLRVNSLDPGATIIQGNYSIVRSNGTNMDIAFTDTFGTVTQVNTGTGLTGGPITTTGTISMANTAVTPAAYGLAGSVAGFTVDAQGRLTAAGNVLISIPISQVQTMTSAELAARVSDETGTGALVFATAPSIGTPTTITLTNATGLPVATGISGLAAGIATFLATPTSANLATAVTNETGTGVLVFATGPTLVNPIVGTQAQVDNSTKAASTAYVDRVGVQQFVSNRDGTANTTAGTAIPLDNTIPQITEGDEIITLAITPKSATSTLIIDASITVSIGVADNVTMALFQNATANALAANTVLTSGLSLQIITLRYVMTSGTTSATTFRIRAGGNNPAPLLVNSDASGPLLSGRMATQISIMEYGV